MVRHFCHVCHRFSMTDLRCAIWGCSKKHNLTEFWSETVYVQVHVFQFLYWISSGNLVNLVTRTLKKSCQTVYSEPYFCKSMVCFLVFKCSSVLYTLYHVSYLHIQLFDVEFANSLIHFTDTRRLLIILLAISISEAQIWKNGSHCLLKIIISPLPQSWVHLP